MARGVYSGRKLNKAWLVVAVILVLFVAGALLDGLIATLVPTYSGVLNLFRAPAVQEEVAK